MSHTQHFTLIDAPRDGDAPSDEPEVNRADRHAVELARVRASVLIVRDPQPSV